ncbi:MAG TPA: hypothetical protein VGY57_02230 [Vicinamibacterales bacterium]|nr:hypothetical protein [Vicinamibacterales bacterium]
MIVRLALRSLTTRPLRTAVLAAGFGFGIAIMVELLGVGEVILEQAHAPALSGGGDILISSAGGPLDAARFLLSNVLKAADLRPRIAAASPSRRATLYLITPDMTLPVTVRGGVPSLQRAIGEPEVAQVASWTDEPDDARWTNPGDGDVLRSMDRFHPIPRLDESEVVSGFSRTMGSSWAEWLYFNGRSADGRVRFYLTFITGPRIGADKRSAAVRLQLDRDGRSTSYTTIASIDERALLERAPDLDIAGNTVRLEGSRYRIALAVQNARGEITLDASLAQSVPPATIRGARGWMSGYVVPVLSGALHGALRVDGQTIGLDGASGYHDHNWGFWEGVTWQWGQVAHDDLSFVYGRVFPPASVADASRVPGFLGVLGPNGPLGFSTSVDISEEGDGSAPKAVKVHAIGARIDLRLEFAVEESEQTRMGLTLAAGGAMTFLQLGGRYRVCGRAGDRDVSFTARGSAETFRHQ